MTLAVLSSGMRAILAGVGMGVCGCVVGGSALAQSNAPIGATAPAVFETVSIAKLAQIAGEISLNGVPMTVQTGRSPDGNAYLVVTDSATGLRIIASGLGMVEGTDEYVAYQLFTVLGDVIPKDPVFVNSFNRKVKHSKLITIDKTSSILATEALVLGGVSDGNLFANFSRMIYGIEKLGEAVSARRNQVSFEPGASMPKLSFISTPEFGLLRDIGFTPSVSVHTTGHQSGAAASHEPAQGGYGARALFGELVDEGIQPAR